MGEAKLVTVSSATHCRDVLEGIWKCFVDKYKVDTEITCNGHTIVAHRVLLAAACPTLFKEFECSARPPDASNRETGLVSLNLDRVTGNGTDMEFLVEFMYRGRATCAEDRLDRLLDTAHVLGLKGLVDAIAELKRDEGLPEAQCEGGATGPPASANRRKRKRPPVKIEQDTGDPATEPPVGTDPAEQTRAPAQGRWGLPRRSTRHALRSGSRPNPSARPEKVVEIAQDGDRAEKEEESGGCGPQGRDGRVAEVETKPKSRKRSSGALPRVSRSEYKKIWRQNRPPLKCEQCRYETRDKDCFKSHLAKHDPSVERYVCDVCSKKFRSKRGFACHQRSHFNPEQLHKCLVCDFHTPQKSSWVQHLAVVHKVDRQGNALSEDYKCPECDFVCVAEHKLKVHVLRKHSTDKPFKCSECEYATFLKYDLDKHVSIRHRNERPYMCEVCGFRSQTQSGCERHKRSHTGEKPFECHVCGQAYADGRKLKIHVQRHVSDDKPFVCHLCGHACRRKDNLQMHLKRIHKTTLDGRGATRQQEEDSVAVPSATDAVTTAGDIVEENGAGLDQDITQSYILSADSVSYIPITYVLQSV